MSGKRALCSAAWIGDEDGYKDEKEFLQDVVITLKNPETNIISQAKELVMEILEENEIQGEETDLKIQIDDLLKGKEKFEFDMDINKDNK